MPIARFRVRHERALAGFLVASLKLCAAAGMVRVGTVALDGTTLPHQNDMDSADIRPQDEQHGGPAPAAPG